MAVTADERNELATFLSTALDARRVEITGMAPILGGVSRVMYRVDADIDGVSRSLVTRADPPDERSSAHSDRDVEWQVLKALTRGGTVPIPAALAYDSSGVVFGQRMIVSEFVQSRTLLTVLREDDLGDGTKHVERLADLCAAIHTADITPLTGVLSAPDDPDTFIEQRIDGWRKIEAGQYEPDPFIRYLVRWLERNKPPAAPLTLVHGGFHARNVVVDDAGKYYAVDWEHPLIGDPREDIGWFQFQGESMLPPDLIGMAGDVFCDRYRERTGFSEAVVNPDSLAYFKLLGGSTSYGPLMKQISALSAGKAESATLLYLTGVVTKAHQVWMSVMRGHSAGVR